MSDALDLALAKIDEAKRQLHSGLSVNAGRLNLEGLNRWMQEQYEQAKEFGLLTALTLLVRNGKPYSDGLEYVIVQPGGITVTIRFRQDTLAFIVNVGQGNIVLDSSDPAKVRFVPHADWIEAVFSEFQTVLARPKFEADQAELTEAIELFKVLTA